MKVTIGRPLELFYILLCLHWNEIIDILHTTIDSAKIQKVQSISRTKKPSPTLIFSSRRWRLSILRCDIWVCSGFSCLFGWLVFYLVSGHAHSGTCAPCCSNNNYCICWGNDYMGPDSPRETCLTLGSCCWGLARSCPWCWAQLSASFGSCSMAQLESHYIKTPGFSVALWLAHSPITEWKREFSSQLHRLHFISIQ